MAMYIPPFHTVSDLCYTSNIAIRGENSLRDKLHFDSILKLSPPQDATTTTSHPTKQKLAPPVSFSKEGDSVTFRLLAPFNLTAFKMTMKVPGVNVPPSSLGGGSGSGGVKGCAPGRMSAASSSTVGGGGCWRRASSSSNNKNNNNNNNNNNAKFDRNAPEYAEWRSNKYSAPVTTFLDSLVSFPKVQSSEDSKESQSVGEGERLLLKHRRRVRSRRRKVMEALVRRELASRKKCPTNNTALVEALSKASSIHRSAKLHTRLAARLESSSPPPPHSSQSKQNPS